MLNPQKDRFVFRDILSALYEWELEKAVATTYSLDVTSLISCMIPLAFSDDVSSHVFKNKIATFTALRNLSKKLVVFCDASQIKRMNIQKEFSVLLENMIVPTSLPKNETGDYPAFHPKLWLLQFRNKEGAHFYRFIVLSRNISYDKCYDSCFVLESSDNHLKTRRTKPVIDFLSYLNNAIDTNNFPTLFSQKNMISALIDDLVSEKVCFSLADERFLDDDFDIYPLFNADYRKNFSRSLFAPEKDAEKEKYDSVFLMSPFVSPQFLDKVHACTKQDVKINLLTRKQAAESLDEKYNQFFDGYILNTAIVEASFSMGDRDDEVKSETSESEGQNVLTDIHAKILALQKKKHSDFYIGSANATDSALNRNVEIIVRIGCNKKFLSPEEIFNEINPSESPLFERILFKKIESEEMTIQKKIERYARILSHADASAEVFTDNETYRIEVYFPMIQSPMEKVRVSISPFSYQEEKTLEEKIIFEDVSLDAISEFYLLKVMYESENETEEDICIERMIKIPTENIPYAERESSVVNKIISDKNAFAEYVTLFLSKTPSATQSEIVAFKESNAKWKMTDAQNPLYETLLKASVLNPNAIKDLEMDLKLMRNTVVSDEFRMMYREFLKAVQASK
ncbi:MAG: hypothetical protein IJ158_14165 [Treponema sp.]|nr:hypothetical protein [Treponema sp.]